MLQASDITYLGAIRMPDEADTTFAYGGLAGRMVNGRLHLFVYGNWVTLKSPVYEIEDPGGGYDTDFTRAPKARLITNWGDLYHGKRVTYYGNGITVNGDNFVPESLFWNESTQLLYWTYYDAYNVARNPDWGLGATRLDDPATGASTAFGPWRASMTDGDGRKYFGPWRCLMLFANPFDGSMMCGSHLQSGNVGSPWGPDAYGGAPWPTTATPAGSTGPDIDMPKRFLEYYFMADTLAPNHVDASGALTGELRSARRALEQPVWENYAALHNTTARVNPALNGGVGSWSDMDTTNGGIWLELTNKRGVIFANFLAGSLLQNPADCIGAAHEWYANPGANPPFGACSHGCSPAGNVGPGTTAAFPAFTIYNPDDLLAVQNGTQVDYRVDPQSVIDLQQTYGIRTAPDRTTSAAKTVRGFYFDPVRKYLFVIANQADISNGPYWIGSLIHVFAIRD